MGDYTVVSGKADDAPRVPGRNTVRCPATFRNSGRHRPTGRPILHQDVRRKPGLSAIGGFPPVFVERQDTQAHRGHHRLEARTSRPASGASSSSGYAPYAGSTPSPSQCAPRPRPTPVSSTSTSRAVNGPLAPPAPLPNVGLQSEILPPHRRTGTPPAAQPAPHQGTYTPATSPSEHVSRPTSAANAISSHSADPTARCSHRRTA